MPATPAPTPGNPPDPRRTLRRGTPARSALAESGSGSNRAAWNPRLYHAGNGLIVLPGLGDEELLEQPDGVSNRHARDEVARRGVQALGFDGPDVQEIGGPFADLFPQAAEDVRGLLELHGCEAVFVHRVEQIAAEFEH